MTEDELEAIEREHRRSEGSLLLYDHALCAGCSAAWPCDAARLLAEVRRLHEAGAELIAELHDAAAPHLYGRETAELTAELAAWRARFGLPAQ